MTIAVTFNTTDNDSNTIQDDLDALARVAYAEAGEMYTYYKNMGKSDAEAAKYSYGVVIDIVINRAASNSSSLYGGTSIQDIIDKNNGVTWQFDAVRTVGGSWTDLPAVSPGTLQLIKDYLAERTNGAESLVGVANDYMNPTRAEQHWDLWGKGMLNKTYFGEDAFDDNGTPYDPTDDVLEDDTVTHITGNANNLRPDPYTITYDIDQDGTIEGGETSDIFTPQTLFPLPRHKPDLLDATPEELDGIAPGAGDNSPGGEDDDGATTDTYTDDVEEKFEDGKANQSPLIMDIDGDGIELGSGRVDYGFTR